MKSGQAASSKHRRAHRVGAIAEAAAAWLRLKGYRVLARRYRSPAGEIDLIVRRGAVIAAVEVKTRSNLVAATEAIGARQQARIARSLEIFVARTPAFAHLTFRFDAVLVLTWPLQRRVADAWRP